MRRATWTICHSDGASLSRRTAKWYAGEIFFNLQQKKDKEQPMTTESDIIAVVAAAIICSAIGATVVAWMFSPDGGAE